MIKMKVDKKVWLFADTESCIRLFDVDEDGRDDILFGVGTIDYVGPKATSLDYMKKMCADKSK